MALRESFAKLARGLSRTRENLGGRLRAVLRPGQPLDEATLEELEAGLLAADLGPALTAQVIEAVRRDGGRSGGGAGAGGGGAGGGSGEGAGWGRKGVSGGGRALKKKKKKERGCLDEGSTHISTRGKSSNEKIKKN